MARVALCMVVLIALAGCFGGSDPGDDETLRPRLPDNVLVYGGPRMPEGFGEVRSTVTDHDGPEPTIGSTSSGALFMAALSDVLRSTDGGASWQVVQSHAGPNNDPMLWVDPVTDRIYNAPMFPPLACASLYWSDDDGDSWTTLPAPACGRAPFDHQKLASGILGPEVNPLAGAQWPTILYMCYNGVAVTDCGVSYDGGQTWLWDRISAANLIPTPITSGCLSGQSGHPTAGPDGTLAFLRTWTCRQPLLTYTLDSGLTWTTVPGPTFPKGAAPAITGATWSIDPEVAWTPDGTLYATFQDGDQHLYLARTRDLGAKWEGPWDVTPPDVGSTVFNVLEAGSDGRIAMAFVGSKDFDGPSSEAPDDTRWHLYIVTSEDAHGDDPTFVSYQATPADDPVQIGCVWQGGGTSPCRNLADFIDGTVAPDGTFYVAYADGCVHGCAGDPEATPDDSRDAKAAAAWLQGWSLQVDAAQGDGVAAPATE